MGNILILAKDKLLLENLLKILSENTFYCDGFLLKEKDLMKKIELIDSLNIFVLEIYDLNLEIKKIIKKIKDKWKGCKILLLIHKIDPQIENFIIEFAIDAYLSLPVSSSQFLRTIYVLNQF